MGAEFGAVEVVMSLFLAGLFGLTGYMLGHFISIRGNQLVVLGVVTAALAAWTIVVFAIDYPHVLAASKAAMIADATLWPLSLGVVCGFFINLRHAEAQDRDDRLV